MYTSLAEGQSELSGPHVFHPAWSAVLGHNVGNRNPATTLAGRRLYPPTKADPLELAKIDAAILDRDIETECQAKLSG